MKSPNKWSCMIMAFATILNVPLQMFIDYIGHDGSELVFDEPYPWRGFHIQEIMDAVEFFGYYVIQYDAAPVSLGINGRMYDVKMNPNRIQEKLINSRGVVAGIAKSGRYHAVAWDGLHVHDPNGDVRTEINMHILYYFRVISAIPQAERYSIYAKLCGGRDAIQSNRK